MSNRALSRALYLTLGYAVVAGTYIVLSSTALRSMAPEPDTYANLELVKGLGFVLATSVLLFLLTRRLLGRVEQEAERLEEAEQALRQSRV